jgi:hypothetical protein
MLFGRGNRYSGIDVLCCEDEIKCCHAKDKVFVSKEVVYGTKLTPPRTLVRELKMPTTNVDYDEGTWQKRFDSIKNSFFVHVRSEITLFD